MVANVTADSFATAALKPELAAFVAALPEGQGPSAAGWGFAPGPLSEGLTFPGQVNYVAKGANLRALGFEPTGATAVAIKHLNTTYLWDKVRVQGGAYGGSSGLDLFGGTFAFTSYRDPNLIDTIAVYDGAAKFLQDGVGEQDLVRSVIGVIGSVDTYRLPDAKGFTSLIWELSGDTEEFGSSGGRRSCRRPRRTSRNWPGCWSRWPPRAKWWCWARRRRSRRRTRSGATSSR